MKSRRTDCSSGSIHSVSMVLIQIRDIDEQVRDELKARAARGGVSFNAYLTSLLEHAAKQTRRLARAAAGLIDVTVI